MSLTTNEVVALLVALGGGAFLKDAVVGLWSWFTGGQARERNALARLRRALEHEESYRRRTAEHAHELRRMLLDLGVRREDIPPFPKRSNDDDEEALE